MTDNHDPHAGRKALARSIRQTILWLIISLALTFEPWFAIPHWITIVSWIFFACALISFIFIITGSLIYLHQHEDEFEEDEK